MLTLAAFHALDWVVLAGYFALLLGTGIYFNAREKNRSAEDYFLAGRRMPVWAVTFSILATAQSAATFIGVPQQAYVGNLVYLSTSIGPLIAAFVVAGVFIPAYYRARVTTPYELLHSRFGAGARKATSVAFLIGRLMASGARTFIGALPVSLAIWGDTHPAHVTVAIAIVMSVGTVYTLWGGVSSVIWTDVIQVCVYLGAAVVAVLVLLHRIPIGIGDLLHTLANTPADPSLGLAGGSKLRIVDAGIPFDPAKEMTLWTALTGFMLLNLAVFATDQDIVQKSLTCPSARQGALTVLTGTLVGIPVVALFLVIGLLLYIYYQRPDIMGGAGPPPGTVLPDSRNIFQTFILGAMPPGLAGLMIAGVLAIGPAGINATLNGMSSTLVNDLYRPLVPAAPARHMVHAGRVGVIACGVAMAGFAIGCVYWQQAAGLTLVSFAMAVMSYAYAGLLGVFLTALLTNRGSSVSVIAALFAGFLGVLVVTPGVWAWLRGPIPLLPDLNLAFPWQLTIGTAVAVAVCCLPRGRGRTGGA